MAMSSCWSRLYPRLAAVHLRSLRAAFEETVATRLCTPRVDSLEAARSQGDRDLAAVKAVVHHEPRQERLASVALDLSLAHAGKRLAQHRGRPAPQARLHDLPRALDRQQQLV